MYSCLRLTEQYKLNTNIPFPISSLLRKFAVFFLRKFRKRAKLHRKFFRKQSADDQTVSQKWKEMVLRQKRLTRTYYDVVTIQMHLDAFSKRKLSQIFDPIFVNVFILVFSLGRVNYYLRYSEIGSRSSNQILR